ncbi:MAG: ISL3 family transposase [Alicyclobacillus sp.]|nr:ISL3 family transposase [Alicyclobacillus sp.]
MIGIDDWAYRRGQRYGTIICDLKRHRVVDILPDRSVSTMANWLRAHPGIQVISSDRAGAYADAIRQALPSATQVADRWHLLKNLGDAVERYLTRHRLPARESQDPCEPEPHRAESKQPTRTEEEQSGRRAAKWERVQQVQQLRKSGLGIRAISRETGLSRQTVRTYLTWTEVPQTVRRSRKTVLDPYKRQIADLLRQSYSGAAIFRRIQEQGYQGSRSTVAQYVAGLRRSSNTGQALVLQHRRVSPRSAARLLTRSEDEMDEQDKLYLEELLEKVEGVRTVRCLFQSFQTLLEKHDRDGLDNWLSEAMTCGIREFRAFAHGIRRDYNAVAAGITEPWSNGQVEGQINRLKMLKRQMYGRASVTLLRARVLCSG